MTPDTKIYLGPPGTGKTQKMIGIVKDELMRVEPERVAYLSFTTKAVNEAKKRVVKDLGVDPKRLVNFKTIHSLGFHLMSLHRDKVLGVDDYEIIGNHLGLEFSQVLKYREEQSILIKPTTKLKGDRYEFIYAFSRARCMSLLDVWDMVDHDDLNWFELERFVEVYNDYKAKYFKYDFGDMLEKLQGQLDVDVLILDEAQDLSTLQWKYIEHTFGLAKRVYISGDDDQAIYEWSGADVEYFLRLPGERIVLDQSWRIPKAVHTIADKISSRIIFRADKEYKSREDEGIVEHWDDIEHIDMSKGTWLILARNKFLLNALAEGVRNMGHNYIVNGLCPVDKKDVRAIRTWLKYQVGEKMTLTQKALLATYSSKMDKDLIWHEAFDKMNLEIKEYYISLLRREESLEHPRIIINTIHSSKGGEADNVVLASDMTVNTWESLNINPDAEHRVWYVGATRCRNALHILSPKTRYNYAF